MTDKPVLALNECEHGVQMLSIDHNGGGVRITRAKCCGRWTVVKVWPMTADDWSTAANECLNAAEAAEKLEP